MSCGFCVHELGRVRTYRRRQVIPRSSQARYSQACLPRMFDPDVESAEWDEHHDVRSLFFSVLVRVPC